MAYNPLNPNGQATMANSQPVVLASDQSSVMTTLRGGTSSVLVINTNQSVSGTIQADIRSSVATVIIGGSIAASFTPPANQSVSGTVQVDVRGSVAAVIIGGSIATATTNSSVMILNGGNMIGSVAAYQGTVPWAVSGSVIAFPVGNQSVSGAVSVSNFPTSQNVSGSVIAFQGTIPWVQTGSVQGTVSVLGTVPVTQATTPWVIGSVYGNFGGSVVSFQGGAPWANTNVGSIIAYLQAPSIVGTYAEDAASATGDKGFLVMGARNDTLSSVTSADGDYSSHVVGPAGELIAANAPFTKWVQGTASMLGGTPVTGSLVPIIAAQGTSIFTYITGFQAANASAGNVWLTLFGGINSVIGFTVAPGNGGSNITFPNALKTNANNAFSASISGVASVYLSAQGFIAKI